MNNQCKVCHKPLELLSENSSIEAWQEQNRLISAGVCRSCDVWMIHYKNRKTTIRIEGQHYDIVPASWGVGFNLTYIKGGKLFTSLVMHQGEVPAPFKKALFDNAKAARRIEVKYVG